MQYILTEEEYNALQKAALVQSPMTEKEIELYFRRIPNFGTQTVSNMIDYMSKDGLKVYRMEATNA